MSVQEQVKWENECVERGTARYYQNQDRLRKQGQVEQVDSTSRLLRDRLEEISEKIKRIAVATKGRAGKYNKLLGHAAGPDEDFLKMAYIGARVVMTALINPKEATATKVCMDISTRLETDLKCRLFEEAYPAYYAVVARSLDEQNVVDYTHKHKVMMKKFNEFNIAWNPWGAVQKVQVGQKVLHCVLQVFEDVVFLEKRWSRGKSQWFLNTTVEFDEWSGEFERERGFLYPYLLPTKTPPASWESLTEGGFYTPRLRAAVPFIKIHRQAAKEWATEHDPEQHRRAVSTMQRTPWRINQKVLEVQSHIYRASLGAGMPSLERIEPPKFPEHLATIEKDNLTDSQKEEIRAWKEIAKRAYAKERERKGKVLAFMQSHKLARELSTWEKFYFVYNCDFRGRIYCATSGLSPQGQDTAKGLLEFATGVELGKDGIKWLAIHGANTYGIDKVSLAKRVEWIKKSEKIIAEIVAHPISNRHLWGAADKPFQFLAFCFEWAACDYGRNATVKSHIPVGMDGSCNGLQHYSAMLRDPVGAAATNLSDSEEPHDIYQEVADVVTRKLQALDDPRAALWLKAGVTRKCAKRPVNIMAGVKLGELREQPDRPILS